MRAVPLLILFHLTGCVVEAAGPAAQVERSPSVAVNISGRLLHQDGTPAAQINVTLQIQQLTEDSGGWFGPCDPEQDPLRCEATRGAQTNAEGNFALTLNGEEVQGSNGLTRALTLLASLGAPPEEVSNLRVGFYAVRAVAFPSVRIWQPGLSLPHQDGMLEYRFAEPTDPQTGKALRTEVIFGTRQGVAWEGPVKPGETITDRMLEDVTASPQLHASATIDVNDTTARLTFSASTRAISGPAGAPASRGSGCNIQSSSGACALTDGNLGENALANLEQQPLQVTVDLGRITRVRHVVVRNLEPPGTVVTSLDGRLWVPLRAPFVSHSNYKVLQPPLPLAARFVRIRAVEPLRTLHEVSVW